MGIIGFNFMRIDAEKTEALKGNISIKNNVALIELKEYKTQMGGDKLKGLSADFEFTTNFSPGGSISIKASILLLEPIEMAEALLKQFNDTKSLPPQVMKGLYDFVIRKCNAKAISLAEDLNLPSPIKMPYVELVAKKTGKKSETQEKQSFSGPRNSRVSLEKEKK